MQSMSTPNYDTFERWLADNLSSLSGLRQATKVKTPSPENRKLARKLYTEFRAFYLMFIQARLEVVSICRDYYAWENTLFTYLDVTAIVGTIRVAETDIDYSEVAAKSLELIARYQKPDIFAKGREFPLPQAISVRIKAPLLRRASEEQTLFKWEDSHLLRDHDAVVLFEGDDLREYTRQLRLQIERECSRAPVTKPERSRVLQQKLDAVQMSVLLDE